MPPESRPIGRRPGSLGWKSTPIRPSQNRSGSRYRLPRNAILLAQAGGKLPARPKGNLTPWGAQEPSPLKTPGQPFSKLTLQDLALPVFGKKGPKADDVVQGQIANCPVAAAMVAFAWARPGALKKRINLVPDKADPSARPKVYTVEFFKKQKPKSKKVTTRFYFKGGAVVYAHSKNNTVIWPNLFEKAYAVFAGHNSYQRLETGGLMSPPDAGQVMEDCFGSYGWSAHSSADGTIQGSLSGLGKTQQKDLIKALTQAKSRPTIAASLPEGTPMPSTKPPIIAQHGYAVLGFSKNKVNLRNPWNSSAPGEADFSLSLRDFQSTFQVVFWAT